MKRIWVLHPLFFAAFPIFFLYARNAQKIRLSDIIEPLGMSIAGAIGAAILFGLICRSLKKGALISTVAVLLFFSFGHVIEVLPGQQLSVAGYDLGMTDIIAAAWSLLFLATVISIFGSSHPMHTPTSILGKLGLFLVALQVIQGGYALARRPEVKAVEPGTYDLSRIPENRPDVYFIVMDAFGRSDVLQEIYGVDNSDFIEFLRDRGFFVADSSYSNYFRTLMSLAATLNMDYLDSALGFVGELKERQLLTDRFYKNAVFNMFNELGYATVTFDKTGCSYTEILPVDIRLSTSGGRTEFESILVSTTVLSLFMQEGRTRESPQRRVITSTLDRLGDITEVESPKFVFAHILSPHRPFVFGPDGAEVPRGRYGDVNTTGRRVRGSLRRDYIAGYADQAAYIGTLLKTTVQDILDRSPDNPPIIIIQGDHGPRSSLDWHSSEKTNLRECFSILNAIYLPGLTGPDLYHQISPVNTFRVIFNEYFGTDFELLPDECRYTPTDLAVPYELIDPERLRGPFDDLLNQRFKDLTTLDRMRLFQRRLTDRPLADCYADGGPLMTFGGNTLELADCRLTNLSSTQYLFEAVIIPHDLPPNKYSLQIKSYPGQKEIVREEDRRRPSRSSIFSARLLVDGFPDGSPIYVKYPVNIPFDPVKYSISIIVPGDHMTEKLPNDNPGRDTVKIGGAGGPLQ